MNKDLRRIGRVLAALTCAASTGVAAAHAPVPAPTDQPAVAPDPLAQSRDVSDLLAPICDANKIPGVVAILIEGDTIKLHGAAGIRTRGSDAKVTINDQFHLGSCTKAMTATLCAMLVEDGTLRWDTTIAEVFPKEVAAEGVDAAWKNVTLLQLLSHHAGVPTDLSADGLWGSLWKIKDPTAARQALLEGVLKHPPKTAPGTGFEYSNGGVAIAGHMAEVKTGIAWETLMQQRVFGHLGITSAGFGAPGKADVVDQPRGHTAAGVAVVPGPIADNPCAIAPAGTAHMTAIDWSKFIAMHLAGARGQDFTGNGCKVMLSADDFTVLHTPYAKRDGKQPPKGEAGADYACGWGVAERPWAGGRVLTHNGSNTMWFSVVWIAPEKNFAVLAACNQGGDKGAKATDDAVSKLIEQWLKPK